MPRLSLLQSNFTAGEISPRLYGRTDIDRYGNAARSLVNAKPVVHGGAQRRPGSRYIAALGIPGLAARYAPFVFSRDAAYQLELGNFYLRIYRAGGSYTGIEIVTPYSANDLADLDYVQGADTMFLAHPLYPIQSLRRLSDTSWDLASTPFLVTPFDEIGSTFGGTTATLSAATVGPGRTITASFAAFRKADVGRQFTSGLGIATITGYTSQTVVTATVVRPFAGVSIPFGFVVTGSPLSFLKPYASGPAGATIYLTAALTRAADISLSSKAVGAGVTVAATAGVFSPADVNQLLYADSGTMQITAYTSPTQITGTISEAFVNTQYSTGGWGIQDEAFTAGDLGKYVRINGGLAKITTVPSSNFVLATVVTAMTSNVVAPALAWSLEDSVWSATRGYPRTITLHEQRLVPAGTTANPQTVWGSRIGEYLDFTKGTNDDDSYSFTIASDEVNPIAYVCSLRNLIVNTFGGEFSMQGGVEKPITPTNVRIRPEGAHGAKNVRPVQIGKESIYVQRSGRKVRAMGYRYEVDGYGAPDLAVLAEHITAPGGITSMAYQQEPDLTLWATRGDGAMVSCTIDREQNVIGWAQHYTDGRIEAVSTIPNGDRDETWLIVRRVVNGLVVRYIEILNDTFAPMLPAAADPNAVPPVTQAAVYGFTVDSGLSFDNAGGQTVFAVPHLIGKTVDIVADGAVQPAQVVPASGNVTLSRASRRTLIGLHFRSEIGLLTPEAGTGTGTAQGNSMRQSELTMRFLNTLGAQVFDGEGQEQDVGFRRFGVDLLDEVPEPFSGNKRIETSGWERGKCEFTVVQNQPLPMHLLSVVRKITIND